jgi:4-hydroxy-4-methyl-2-oxoglutarate aldolase
MADAKLKITRTFERPSEGLVAAFANAPTGPVVDAMGRRGALDGAIRPLTRNAQFCGSALTVWTVPRDNLAPYAALKFAQPGDVLVVATGGADEVSVLGDIAIGMARNAGIVAIVTDGLVRDLEGIEKVGIPVFARGLSPNSPFKNGPGEIGGTVALGRNTVSAGDIVIGDGDGVVVVPLGDANAVKVNLEAVKKKEHDMEAKVASGAAVPDWLDDVLAGSDIEFRN